MEKTLKKEIEMIPYGTAYINGFRMVFNPRTFKKGKRKGMVECYYKKGYKFKKIVLNPLDITPLPVKENQNDEMGL